MSIPLLKNRERRLPAIGAHERGVVDALGIQIDRRARLWFCHSLEWLAGISETGIPVSLLLHRWPVLC